MTERKTDNIPPLKLFLRYALPLILLLPLSLSTLFAAESAASINSRGERLYRQKKYPQALELFHQAVNAGPEYAPAHYNVARTLARLRKNGEVCMYDAYQAAILEYLDRSIELDPANLDRMKNDPAFIVIRGTFRYQTLLGLKTDNTADVTRLLVAITWYGPQPGAYGPISGMSFSNDGRVKMWYLSWDDMEVPHKETIGGKFEVEGNNVTIQFDGQIEDGLKVVSGKLTRDGQLDFNGVIGPFTDDPEECSA